MTTKPVVRKLSDGEELVIDGWTPRALGDPREPPIEVRRLASEDPEDDETPNRNKP